MALPRSAAKPGLGALRDSQVISSIYSYLNLLYYLIVWIEYLFLFRPEQHILLFRRPLGTDPITGNVDAELEREAKEKYYQEVAAAQRR